jgi:hypothetical protein
VSAHLKLLQRGCRVAEAEIEFRECETRTGGGRTEVVGKRPRDRLGRQRATFGLVSMECGYSREQRKEDGFEVVLSEFARDLDSLRCVRRGLYNSLLNGVGVSAEEEANRELLERPA